MNAVRVGFCRECGNAFLGRWSHGQWGRYCSLSCSNRARYGRRPQALAAMGGEPRAWFVTRLNAGVSHDVLADLIGMDRRTMYAWWRDLGIRKVSYYE